MGILGGLLSGLSGAAKGYTAQQTQNPINAVNNVAAAQAQQDLQGQQLGQQYLSSIFQGAGTDNTSAWVPTQSVSQPPIQPSGTGAPPPVIGGGIMPPSGQPMPPRPMPQAQPQQAPTVALQPQRQPAVAAPVNQAATQSQSPTENPLLSALQPLAPVLKDPKFRSLPPSAQKYVMQTLMQMQAQQAKQQDMVAQQKLRQAQTDYYGQRPDIERERIDTTKRGQDMRQRGGGGKAKLSNDPEYQELKSQYLEAEKDYRASPNPENKKAADVARKAYQGYGKSSSKQTSGEGEVVNVISPDGEEGTIPADQLDEAVAAGFKKQ